MEDFLLRVEHVSKHYSGHTALDDVSLDIPRGSVYGLLGPNGAGKTTTFYMIVGLIKPNEGKIFLEDNEGRVAELTDEPVYRRAQMGVGYLAQEASVFRRLSVEDNIRAVLEMTRFSKEYQAERVEALIKEFRLEKVRKSMGIQLSGGERARLKLCMLMNSAVNMLILDEPTNHLDLDSREWIESAVDQFEGTLLIVSHDRYFVNRFANRIWELDNGRLRSFDCGYEKYRFIREREDEAAQQEQARQREAEKAERAEKAEKKPARRDGKIERRMNVLERDIAKLEQQLDALDAQMEENASDYVRLGELEEQKNALQAQMDTLYEEWEQLDSSLS